MALTSPLLVTPGDPCPGVGRQLQHCGGGQVRPGARLRTQQLQPGALQGSVLCLGICSCSCTRSCTWSWPCPWCPYLDCPQLGISEGLTFYMPVESRDLGQHKWEQVGPLGCFFWGQIWSKPLGHWCSCSYGSQIKIIPKDFKNL